MKEIFKTLGYYDTKEREDALEDYKEYMYDLPVDSSVQSLSSGFDSYLYETNSEWCSTVMDRFKELMNGKRYKINAVLGLWDGDHKAHRFADGFEAITACLSEADDFKIFEERGTLKITARHHDGTNRFSIKEITDKGLRSPHFYNAF